MHITQLRNATIIIATGAHRILVDPMLAPKERCRHCACSTASACAIPSSTCPRMPRKRWLASPTA
ncbi:hypothetical protein LP420_09290 [Massilia sp. B-10]|nr:hypothetical protein LP420_09290 [Massilia sp. B-10]